MAEHPVRRKLEQAILPYTVSAERLRMRPVYLTYGVYSYAHELLIAVVGLGIAPPLLSLFSTDFSRPSNRGTIANAVSAWGKAPPWLVAITAIALIVWLLLKILINREDVAKRAVLARSCRKEMRQFTMRLRDELQKSDPMPGLQKIQGAISDLVYHHIQEDLWPWDGPAENIDGSVRAKLERLCKQFGNNWQPAPDVDQV